MCNNDYTLITKEISNLVSEKNIVTNTFIHKTLFFKQFKVDSKIKGKVQGWPGHGGELNRVLGAAKKG